MVGQIYAVRFDSFRLARLRRTSAAFSSIAFFGTANSAFASFSNRWKGERELGWSSFAMRPAYALSGRSWKSAFAATLAVN